MKIQRQNYQSMCPVGQACQTAKKLQIPPSGVHEGFSWMLHKLLNLELPERGGCELPYPKREI